MDDKQQKREFLFDKSVFGLLSATYTFTLFANCKLFSVCFTGAQKKKQKKLQHMFQSFDMKKKNEEENALIANC